MIQTLIFDELLLRSDTVSCFYSYDIDNDMHNRFTIPNSIIIRQMISNKCYVVINEENLHLVKRILDIHFSEIDVNDNEGSFFNN